MKAKEKRRRRKTPGYISKELEQFMFPVSRMGGQSYFGYGRGEADEKSKSQQSTEKSFTSSV